MKKDGGSAFPFSWNENEPGVMVAHPGMTIRQWYKGQALAGLFANQEGTAISERIGIADGIKAIDGIVNRCSSIADFFIAEDIAFNQKETK